LLPRKKWWELEIELQAVTHSPRTLEDAPGQHLLERAFFNEVQSERSPRTATSTMMTTMTTMFYRYR
jgi:hypothetical protein